MRYDVLVSKNVEFTTWVTVEAPSEDAAQWAARSWAWELGDDCWDKDDESPVAERIEPARDHDEVDIVADENGEWTVPEKEEDTEQ